VTAKSGALTSASVNVNVQSAAPAFFKNDKYAIAVRADGTTVVDPNAPAGAGEVITLYGSGFGPVAPAVEDGELVNSPRNVANPVTIRMGGAQADVLFAGLVSPGLYQINVKVPSNLASGDVPVVAVSAGVQSPDGLLLAAKASEPAPPMTPPAPAVYSADINNFQFLPPSIEVQVGGELSWTNKQAVPHTVVADDGAFGSKVLDQNDAFSFKFTAPGVFSYHCSLHPFMKGTVVVK
jgi:amicyanin